MTAEESARSYLYDGFISYSHAADDLLAPRLQAGLQRFAKPWWRRRAVRLFRDESSLAANPHLWSSIVEALDSSEWFVLLLSPEAAGSVWVGREIEHWLADRDPGRIIPVVTSGDFGWLHGVFLEEPRWVDFRFAKGETQLDLNNPEFAAAVADVASAIRGVPKDELASEEVKQHRRTIRTVWVAGLALVSLAVAAVGFAISADRQAKIAEENERLAIAEADRAVAAEEAEARQRALAESEAERAIASRDFAVAAAADAEAQRLLDHGIREVDRDPETAIVLVLLAVVEAEDANDPETIRQRAIPLLVDALGAYRVRASWEDGRLALSPDGTRLYSIDDDLIEARDVESNATLWSHPLGDVQLARIAVSPDGETVVVSANRTRASPVLIVFASDGSKTTEIPIGDCRVSEAVWAPGFSGDGRYFAEFVGSANCDEDAEESWVTVFETENWTPVQQVRSTPDVEFGGPLGVEDTVHFSADAGLVLVSGRGAFTELRTFPDLELVRRYGSGHKDAALSPNGELVAIRSLGNNPILIDAATGEPVVELRLDTGLTEGAHDSVGFSPDGTKTVVKVGQWVYVFEVPSGQLLVRLDVPFAGPEHYWTTDGNHLLWRRALYYVGAQEELDFPLDFVQLVEIARTSLSEIAMDCVHFRIDPCPTLSDLKGD